MLSVNGESFFVNFVEDYSRFNWLFVVLAKSSVRDVFVRFKLMIERQLDLKIQKIQRDNGGGQFLRSWEFFTGSHVLMFINR